METAAAARSFSVQCLEDVSNLEKDTPVAVVPAEDGEWAEGGAVESDSRETFVEATTALKEMAAKPHLQMVKIAPHWGPMMMELGDDQLKALVNRVLRADARAGATQMKGNDDDEDGDGDETGSPAADIDENVGSTVDRKKRDEVLLDADIASFIKKFEDAVVVLDTFVSRGDTGNGGAYFIGLAQVAVVNLRSILTYVGTVEEAKTFAKESAAATRRKQSVFARMKSRLMRPGAQNKKHKRLKRKDTGKLDVLQGVLGGGKRRGLSGKKDMRMRSELELTREDSDEEEEKNADEEKKIAGTFTFRGFGGASRAPSPTLKAGKAMGSQGMSTFLNKFGATMQQDKKKKSLEAPVEEEKSYRTMVASTYY